MHMHRTLCSNIACACLQTNPKLVHTTHICNLLFSHFLTSHATSPLPMPHTHQTLHLALQGLVQCAHTHCETWPQLCEKCVSHDCGLIGIHTSCSEGVPHMMCWFWPQCLFPCPDLLALLVLCVCVCACVCVVCVGKSGHSTAIISHDTHEHPHTHTQTCDGVFISSSILSCYWSSFEWHLMPYLPRHSLLLIISGSPLVNTQTPAHTHTHTHTLVEATSFPVAQIKLSVTHTTQKAMLTLHASHFIQGHLQRWRSVSH